MGRRRSAAADSSALQLIAQVREGGPAGIGLGVLVLVGLDVQVLAADRAQTRAVGAAQDLIRDLERDRVAQPCRELQVVVDDVVRPQLVAPRSALVVELAHGHGDPRLCPLEAAHARADEADLSTKVEHHRPRRLGDLELDGRRRRIRLVSLAAEVERLEIDVETLSPNFSRSQPQAPKVEHTGHEVSVAPRHVPGTD